MLCIIILHFIETIFYTNVTFLTIKIFTGLNLYKANSYCTNRKGGWYTKSSLEKCFDHCHRFQKYGIKHFTYTASTQSCVCCGDPPALVTLDSSPASVYVIGGKDNLFFKHNIFIMHINLCIKIA